MRTKIILTIGPKSESPEVLEGLVKAGFDIARMNFSHCTYDEFIGRKKLIRQFEKKYKKHIGILQDLQGPRIRVGLLPKEGREMKKGEVVVFSTAKVGEGKSIFVDDSHLHLDIRKNDPIYLSNGDIELVVKKMKGPHIYAEVLRGGVLHSRKQVNVPNTALTASGLTAKDIKDLRFGLKQGIDYVGISFVQSAADIIRARKYVGTKVKIIAKIETALALKNIDTIIQAADGIMIARGDLGVEVPSEQVPFIQKNLIRQSIWHSKPSITATQILMSMVNHQNPTRAEVSDLANAVFDGTDAIMLSDETASGEYPVRALKAAIRVIRQAELDMNRPNYL